MRKTNTVIIGAGQAGLAVSRCLQERGIEHVLLEQGEVGQRWSERWDSLRLLTPNWMTRLPGFAYAGGDPDGFMARDEVRSFLRSYAVESQAPVEERTTVRRVSRDRENWRVETTRGAWAARNVVIATGHAQMTRVPAIASSLPPGVLQIAASDYRNPSQVPPGTVLVVGASASGVQLADELAGAGRRVILAVGRHTRLPRRYRGRDILYWLDRVGSLQRPLSDMPDEAEAHREPSLQLSGRGGDLDLATLHRIGVRLTGRLVSVDGDRLRFADDLARHTAAADSQMGHLLARIDRHIAAHGLDAGLPPAEPWMLTPRVDAPTELSLRGEGIATVLWATGYRRSYPWLDASLLDAEGEVRQHRGRAAAGLYVIGLQFMTRRNSSFIDGVGRDAREIAASIAARESGATREAA